MVGCHVLKTDTRKSAVVSQSDCEKTAQCNAWVCSTTVQHKTGSAELFCKCSPDKCIWKSAVQVIVRMANSKLQVLNNRLGTVCIIIYPTFI